MRNPNEATYNTIPHFIATDFRAGKLTRNELALLLWLRAIGNPYGIATTSLEALRDDMFPDLKKNTVNTILLSLFKKCYVFFERRQGRKGSFDIHLDHWKMPNGYKTLDRFFDSSIRDSESKGTRGVAYPQAKASEVSQKSEVPNQKWREQTNELVKRFSVDAPSAPIRSRHNEHENENKNNDTLGNYEGGTPVGAFVPRNYEEQRCAEIAKEVGEQYINPLMHVLRKDGFRIIERAWGIYREDRESKRRIDKPAAYFYAIIKNLREKP